ncbi:hypothetical protein ACR782_00835 [Sphingobacterium spiritivorum]|uniref:hypothetical protein n=1 Tax=Sphingobacterium spiritivorum TaxID=258 RepID=UPI003DA44B6D
MQKHFIQGLKKTASTLFIALGILSFGTAVYAQKSTSASPYSKLGIGQMRLDLLPQTRAMGGISTGLRYLGGTNTMNIANPASYSGFHHTIFDAGLYGNVTQLEKGSAADNTADFAFSHITMGIPLGKAGGVALGLMPFSDVGYSYNNIKTLDTLSYRSTLSGEGGLNKAFIGYGISPFKGFSIGANLSYIFGNLTDISKIEFPYSLGAYNTTQKNIRSFSGASLDYGVQYFKSLGNKLNLTVGYSGSLNNTIKDKSTVLITRTQPSLSDVENIATDTSYINEKGSRNINLPLKHNVGFTLAKSNKWLVGADFKYADWSDFQVRQGEQQLGKSYGVAIGGQFTPDPSSIRYLNLVDYRIGFRYDKTQMNINGTDIKDMAITLGMGLPLPSTPYSRAFSKINVSAELGQMGTLSNNLVRERYINFNIGFTLNDKWFSRRNYD